MAAAAEASAAVERPHSAHDRTREWRSCCAEIVMGRDPRLQRFVVVDDDDDGDGRADDYFDDDGNDSQFGCWSSPGCLAINLIEDEGDHRDGRADLDSWTTAALALSASVDEVSSMIRRKGAAYASSNDALDLFFREGSGGGGAGANCAMTKADRSILETTVASFVAGMSKQIESLRLSVAVEGEHPFVKTADGDDAAHASRRWSTGPIGHRAGIAACLMQRLKSEVMDAMTTLQARRASSDGRDGDGGSGDEASSVARNPMRPFRAGGDRRPPPPAPWEVGVHDAERDRAERDQEKDNFLDVYGEGTGAGVPPEGVSERMLPPASVLRFMDLPKPPSTDDDRPQTRQYQQSTPTIAVQRVPQQDATTPMYDDEDHVDQLQRESATLLATYQHSDLEGVQKAERSMVEIASLLSRFTDLISEQQEDIFLIHDQALKSKENVDKGQDQLVDAADRGEKSKHPMATFVMAAAILLLLFNWITP
ncbi:hypothetical protein ACHAWF_013028 [Thalassiosira exigua]